MSDRTNSEPTPGGQEPTPGGSLEGHEIPGGPPGPRWRVVGPGLVAAATGVGAGDLVATLVAGSRYGYALLWAAVLGCALKIVLVEATGRFTLASGRTLFDGWRSLGRLTTWYFAPYILLWGFVYGAAAMSSTALPLAALFPSVDLKLFAVGSGLLGLLLVWFGRYGLLEKVMSALVGLMFVTVVGAAAVTLPNLPAMLTGLWPTIPDGSMFYVLGLAGGVGGSITLAAYGYWLREKGWSDDRWMRVMRLDNAVAYAATGIFVVSMLVMGAELLYSGGLAAQGAIRGGDSGLLDLADVLASRYGRFWSVVFLVGFWASSFSSLLGVLNGVSLLFADFVRPMRPASANAPLAHGPAFRAYALWLTLPPIALLFLDEPVGLILAYGVLGSLFMPFLAITLLLLLNSDRVPAAWRNGLVRNTLLGGCAALFVLLGAHELLRLVLI